MLNFLKQIFEFIKVLDELPDSFSVESLSLPQKMTKFCVLKSTIANNEGMIIVNQSEIFSLGIDNHPATNEEVYRVEFQGKGFYFNEFIAKECSLQEALEYYHHAHFQAK